MAQKQTQSAKINSSFTSAPPAHGAKSGFVRSLPLEMSAKEVIAKGKGEGLVLTEAYVYNVRAVARMRFKAASATPQQDAVTAKRQLPPVNVGGGDNGEARMRKLIAEIGLARARAVLADVRQAFG